MIGHGGPASLAMALARATLAVCALLCGRTIGQSTPPAEPVHLRITWGGGDPIRWVGQLGVDSGVVSDLQILDSEPDAVGAIWLEEGQLRVRSLSAHKVDSVEITVDSGAPSKLQVNLGSSDKNAPTRLDIQLNEVVRHPVQIRLDDRGNTLEVQHIPPPALRILANREPLIFNPGEQFAFEISPAVPNLVAGTDVVIQTTMTPLSPACRKESPWSQSQHLPVPIDGHPKAVVNVPLAKTEGVYNIHIAVSRPSGFDKSWTTLTRLATSTRLAEHSFQVVVLDSHPLTASVTATKWESVLEIDPTNPRWIERLPAWTHLRRIPGFNHGALGSTYAEVKQLPLGRFVELPSMPPNGDPNWQAYSLPLEAIGFPHMLEIDYPADVEQHFAATIVEPNASGFVSGANRDTGVYVEGFGRNEAKQTQTQRLVFWPRTQAPLLVVSNMHSTEPAHFGQIRVLKSGTSALSATVPKRPVSRDRLIAAYFAKPTVAAEFGTCSGVDSLGLTNSQKANCDTAETAYESATRLADYLHFSGYNCAVVAIKSDGNGQSPASKTLRTDLDSVELMLRVFDREDISLLTALDLSVPLESLEPRRRKTGAQTSGLEWVNRNGQSWLEANGSSGGFAPYYNLLDQRVQQALLENIRDVITRYERHPAFAGVAIQLSSLGYAQLPSLEWGLDDVTFARFASDCGIQLPDSGPKRFESRYRLLTGGQSAAWRAWRNRQVSGFYAQVASLIRGNTDRRLVLTTENVCADLQVAQGMQPSLNAHEPGSRILSTLSNVGIDRESLEKIPGVTLCPTLYVEPMTVLPDRAIDLELNDEFASWRRPSVPGTSRAAVFYHRPVHQRLASFEMVGRPWRVAGEMQLVTHPMAGGPTARQPYVEALAEHDPTLIIDGGERLPLGQESLLREIRTLFSQLPASAAVMELTKQPILVRTYSEPDRTTVVAMNLSPWSTKANVNLLLPQATQIEQLLPSADEETASKQNAVPGGLYPWTVPFEPFEIRAIRVRGGSKVTDVQILGGNSNPELIAKLADLKSRDLTAKSDYQVLANPSFETMGTNANIVGWQLAPGSPRADLQLDSVNPQDGRSSLLIQADAHGAIVESDAFPITPTGQLAMTVYARGRHLAPGCDLHLVVKGDCDGREFRREGIIPGNEMQSVDDQWGQPFAIFPSDLPLQPKTQMRIAFELTGAGEIWLDNVKLSSVLLSYPTYSQADCIELSRILYSAETALQSGRISDCSRIVDGYWARFILSYRPASVAKLAERPPTGTPALSNVPSDPAPEPAPSFGDRFKRIFQFNR